jgi:hypothetical protein
VTVRPERETLEASIVAHLREWADASQINYPDSQAQGEMRWWMRQAADYIAALAAAPDARLAEALEAALMDANVTYGIINEDGSGTPMMVERQAIVKAMGYEDESAWLAVEDLIREIAAARWAFENLGEQLDDQQQRWMLEAERLLVEGHISIAECLKSVVHQLAALRIRVAKGSSEEEAER